MTKLEECLNDYFDYHHSILLPTLEEVELKVSHNDLKLHQAIGFNMVIAHALDYLLAIENARCTTRQFRKNLMIKLDSGYSIEGGKFKNDKFHLIDAVNNTIKHISLDTSRYKNIVEDYGMMSFRLLVEESGVVYLKTDNYQFDYGRIVLRSISKILKFSYDDPNLILGTIDGEDAFIGCSGSGLDPSDPSTAIDRMIEFCNPVCIDCDEVEDECNCEVFVYGQEQGEFSPDFDYGFDVESTMSEIGSSWD